MRHARNGPVNGTLNLTQACRYRHFEPDPPASSVWALIIAAIVLGGAKVVARVFGVL
jgi:hypothetical protein